MKNLKNHVLGPTNMHCTHFAQSLEENALVINASRTWMSIQLQEGMTFDAVLEMCKTRLLYLGNNLYAVLRRKPFTIDRPLELSIQHIHKNRRLIEDKSRRHS